MNKGYEYLDYDGMALAELLRIHAMLQEKLALPTSQVSGYFRKLYYDEMLQVSNAMQHKTSEEWEEHLNAKVSTQESSDVDMSMGYARRIPYPYIGK